MGRISYLLNRYLDNTCTRQEMDELLDYIEHHPQDKLLMEALQNSWDAEDSSDPVVTGTRSHPELVPVREEEVVRSQKFPWKVAACILVLAACISAFFLGPENINAPLAENQYLHETAVNTERDEHRLTVLSEGSKIWINSNSKLTYDPSFTGKVREVALEGEAFFDIQPDPDRPFIIKTGKVKTTVLGTTFNIRAFPSENAVTVTVTRGKVSVQAENRKGETITANQQIKLNLQTEQLEEHVVDAAEVTQWIKGDLILHEVTFGEVEEILEERYSVDIRFDNALLKKCRFTSTFLHNASLEEVITALCLVNGASYEVTNKVITILGKGCDENEVQPLGN